jgi:hypothetical protein
VRPGVDGDVGERVGAGHGVGHPVVDAGVLAPACTFNIGRDLDWVLIDSVSGR